MSLISKALDTLKNELQNETDSSGFEKLAAALIGRLLDVPIAVASSGFQHGADAGPAGQQGRRFRLECKKYSDKTGFDERKLLGEIQHAVRRDQALEAWILVTTRTVPEQIRQSLDQCGDWHGVPILIFDWQDHEIGPLVALCASSPDLVDTIFSSAAGRAARDLQIASVAAIKRLKRDLQSWCVGFEWLRRKSHERLDKIWNRPKESTAAFGQNVAGGNTRRKVRRQSVHDALDHWWRESAQNASPAAIIGSEGTGKTWATLEWLIDTKATRPIVLLAPSSVATSMSNGSESNLKRFLAERLHEVCGVRDANHWHLRLEYLLKRPLSEGPVLIVVLDGLNQEPSLPWIRILQVLQSETFSGRVRVIVSTRKPHFDNKLSKLDGLFDQAVPIAVDHYDATQGGELDRMLEHEDLVRADLNSDILKLARTPRLFRLVVRLKDRFVAGDQLSLHQLLWEYGRDTLGTSFSQDEWRDWLKDVARQYREGIRECTIKSLGETVSRPELEKREVYARLNEIVRGRYEKLDASDNFVLEPAIVAYALAITLLKHLGKIRSHTFEVLDAKLKRWLDPISGFDQAAEILRAAVLILVEKGDGALSTAGVLLTAWLQAQNVPDAHRQEIACLASRLPGALLDAVEHSEDDAHESARFWAVKALRTIPRTDDAVLEILVERTRQWMGTVYRDIDSQRKRSDEQRKWREGHLSKLIGTHCAGNTSVVGVELNLVDRYPGLVKSTVPSILEGFPLCKALPTFEAAATVLAAGDHSGCWETLKWLCLLNEVDPEETAEGLRDLSEKVRCRVPEPGVHPELPERVAALLLWLTGFEKDDKAAALLNPDIGRGRNYERDYLSNPGRSFFALERRHAQVVLQDSGLAVQSRVKRIGELWLDPAFEPSDEFVTELRDLAAKTDVAKLNRCMGPTVDDFNFDELEPALARFAPDLLADLMRRKLRRLENCPTDSRYWGAISATNQFILSGEAEAAAASVLRRKRRENDNASELSAVSRLLMIEIRNLPGRKQLETLIKSDLPGILLDFAEVLRPLAPKDVDALIRRFDATSQKQQRDLLNLLPLKQVELSDGAWSWVQRFVKHEDDDFAMLAFRILNVANKRRFGHQLLDDGWSWGTQKHHDINHFGTDSLIEASNSLSFDSLAPRLAPWRLLEAVRRRGSVPEEVRLAAMMFSAALTDQSLGELDPGSTLSIDQSRVGFLPFSYSVTPHRSQNTIEAMELAFDPEANLEAHQRAVDVAASRIDDARRSGAVLFHAPLDKRDFEPVIKYERVYIDQWLEGYTGPTAEFENRVHLAEGAFLALCEALLIKDPARGVHLWRVLNETLRTRYIGAAGVDSLLNMVFRVPDSPEVVKLRDEIWKPKYVRADDRALLDVAIATAFNGKTQWLNELIRKDRASRYAWRRTRAMVLDGFRADNSLPIAKAWPDGELKATNAWLEYRSVRSKWIEACARHWWRAYLAATDPSAAYAAWVLFLRVADRRIWTWIRQEIDAVSEKDDFYKQKMAHVRINRDELKRACKEREKELDQNFLYRKIVDGIGPWA